ncbi:Uncharacterised protein [Shewanella putrefaciens]|nr:Uncharacterised protein [Shewanella putrefaciens]
MIVGKALLYRVAAMSTFIIQVILGLHFNFVTSAKNY